MSVARYVEALSANVVAALELPCWECEQLRVRRLAGDVILSRQGGIRNCM
jgi:hypothetical protein